MALFALALSWIVIGVLTVPMIVLLASFDPFASLSVNAIAGLRVRLVIHFVLVLALAVGIAAFLAAREGGDPVRIAEIYASVFAGYYATRWAVRRFVWDSWRHGSLSHRQAALVTSLIGPGGWCIAATAFFVSDLIDRIVLGATAVPTILLSYGMALMLFRWIGGEYDPPASSGYRRRP